MINLSETSFLITPVLSTMNAVSKTVALLKNHGNVVEAENIEGLWRINGGPELTCNQLLQVASQLI